MAVEDLLVEWRYIEKIDNELVDGIAEVLSGKKRVLALEEIGDAPFSCREKMFVYSANSAFEVQRSLRGKRETPLLAARLLLIDHYRRLQRIGSLFLDGRSADKLWVHAAMYEVLEELKDKEGYGWLEKDFQRWKRFFVAKYDLGMIAADLEETLPDVPLKGELPNVKAAIKGFLPIVYKENLRIPYRINELTRQEGKEPEVLDNMIWDTTHFYIEMSKRFRNADIEPKTSYTGRMLFQAALIRMHSIPETEFGYEMVPTRALGILDEQIGLLLVGDHIDSQQADTLWGHYRNLYRSIRRKPSSADL